MFTGLYPHEHGNQMNGHRLAADRVTLAQILRSAGFQTAAFVSGLPMQAEVTGLARGFDVYDDRIGKDSHRDGRATVAEALRWLARRDRTRPAFLFVHLYDAHAPYLPSGRYAQLYRSAEPGPPLGHVQPGHVVSDRDGRPQRYLNGYIDRYDAMIHFTDDAFGELLSQLDLARTVLVVIADHGETLGERYHQLDHGGEVWDEQIRIPLLIAARGFAPGRVEQYVETVDLLPTLLELLAVPLPERIPQRGRSLVPFMRGEKLAGREVVFASSRCDPTRLEDRGYQLDKERQIHAVRSSRWKLIVYPGIQHDYTELYDLDADAAEQRNVAVENPLLVRSLLQKIEEWRGAGSIAVPTPDVDPQTRERLRQLGYVD
jgi:arylsulfatase A-like enzyme